MYSLLSVKQESSRMVFYEVTVRAEVRMSSVPSNYRSTKETGDCVLINH